MGTTVTFNYRDQQAVDYAQPIVDQLRETNTFREIEALAASRGYDNIDVYTIQNSPTPGRAIVTQNGTAVIEINTSEVFYSESFNPGLYNNPTGSRIVNIPTFSRPLPQGEIFAHELAHFALGHFEDEKTDLFFGGVLLNENEAIHLTNQLRDELGLPLRVGHSLDLRIADGYYPFDPASNFNDHCFKADTPIQMWPLDPSIKPRPDGTYDEQLVLSKVWKKPISDIRVGDLVISYDDKGRIKPGPVTRTMTNTATHLLDFWNTGVTPGHAYYCAEGKFKDQHVPLMDILRTDGAIMRTDGTIIRAATNCKVGSMGDMMIHASATLQKPDGTWTEPKAGKVRFGTRIILPDGQHMSFMEMAASEGWRISDDGYMVGMMKGEDGELQEQKFHFPYAHGEELPKPEDYILARSKVSLEAIYAAGEWEQIGTRMPAPAGMVGLNTKHTSTLLQPSKPEPNIPPAFADHPDAPRNLISP